MASPIPIPPELQHRAFTTAEAEAAGISRVVLSTGTRFQRLFRGVWATADLALTERTRINAALLVLPTDTVVSHVTALRLFGVEGIEGAADACLHFSTNTSLRTSQEGICLHRRLGTLHPTDADGIPVTGPDRAFVDSATLLSHRHLVRAGDELVRLGMTTPEQLCAYAEERHLDGVRRARRAAPLVRAGVESVRETDLRLLLRFARLPEPEVNGWIVNDVGVAIARGDLVYRAFLVLAEYDGWHHERDARQRQNDHLRRERLEAAGWTVIVITAADLKDPIGVVRRVHRALVSRGYRGPSPVMSTTWHRWFNAA